MDKGGEAFEYLIRLNNYNDPFNGELPPECCCEGEGHNDEPGAYKVHFHGEFSVASALENTQPQ